MKGLFPLFLGLFGTFAFSWIGLTVIPNYQIGHLDPQSDEEGTDVYPVPQSGMVERGRQVYNANGCVYCHSQWVRADYAGSDLERKWGTRRSAPRDYIFDRPVLLGKMRTGPDLSNLGQRAPEPDQSASPAAASASPSPAPSAAAAASPATGASPAPATAQVSPAPAASPAGEEPPYSAAWLHRHLYSPRSIAIDSIMPAYRFLYEKRQYSGQLSDNRVKLTGKDIPPYGWEIVPTYDAECLVAYLMALNQSHPLNETKSAFAASPVAASPSPAASPAPSAK